jgi:ATP-dependent helicase HrpA
MREWQDVYSQLHDALEDLGTLRLNESNAACAAIHRSILAGLIGHVARFEERNNYKAASNKLLSVFPGSALYARGEPQRKPILKGSKPPPKPKSSQPPWIVAGEIVETSQLFARTLAGIEPEWIFQLAPHCCKLTHQNPHWSASAGNVLVEEIVTLHGLEVQRRKIAYGNINPRDATAIFIRSALVEENLTASRTREEDADADRDEVRVFTSVAVAKSDLPPSYRFLTHNRRIREKIENWRTRVRQHGLADLDVTLAAFYARHITAVSSLHELNRLLRDPTMPERLCISEAELAGGQLLGYDAAAFPDAVPVSGQSVMLAYAYAPGAEHDGVTIELPFTLAQTASAALLEWAVPGLREEMTGELLRALPKSIRRELMPFPPKVTEIVCEFQPAGTSFLQDFAAFLHRRYGVAVKASDWPANALPAHLRPRIDVVDDSRKSLGAGRDLAQLQQRLKQMKTEPVAKPDSADWTRATQQWERFGLTDWTCGDLPERITVSEGQPLPQYAWPAIEFAEGSVNVRLLHARDLARATSLSGVRRLVELAVQKDLAWLEKDLRALSRFDALYSSLGDSAELRETSLEHLKRYILPNEPLPALTRVHFETAVAQARQRLPGLASQFMDRLGVILQLREQLRQRIGAGMASPLLRPRTLSSLDQLGSKTTIRAINPLLGELSSLVSSRFLERIAYDRLPHLPRYLKGLLVRAERAVLNPAKNQDRLRQLAPYQDALREFQVQPARSPGALHQIETFRWMVEEFKISLFAQEIGTAMPVSPKRLDQQLEIIRNTA